VAEKLNVSEFKASNGWLDKFKLRYKIVFKTMCGESKDVDPEVVNDWKTKLEKMCELYDLQNIFNLNETGLFYRILPNKTLALKGETCSSGKQSKERLTVLLCVNMLGDFETPFIIGKSKKPRCFKNVNVNQLGVTWVSNKKAWMTLSLMSDWLYKFDKKNA